MIDDALVTRARHAAEAIAPLATRIEADRRLPPSAVDALVQSGVCKVFVPRVYGGAQAHPATAVAMIEQIARADGSAGWCAMIGATSGLMSVYLDDAIAREIYAPDDAITCGVFAPMGRATSEGDGFKVSGRWPFASGCEHSQWRMGGTIADGSPDVRSVLFRASETRVIDTWETSGLRGTGSHDIEATEVFVPRNRTFSLTADKPKHDGYTLPFFGVLASGVAAVGLGIARAAVDTFSGIAKTKMPPGSKRTLAHRESVQLDVAHAEAKLRAARAFLFEAIAEATATSTPSMATRARLRLAAAHAADESAAVTTLVYRSAGGSAIYSKSPLQRYFRDANVVTQHLMVQGTANLMAGRVLLDVESDTTLL